ncbi:UNVERIFIED_CONTAM: hypothetical protein NCL1_43207 [Trichonephila clavipes]
MLNPSRAGVSARPSRPKVKPCGSKRPAGRTASTLQLGRPSRKTVAASPNFAPGITNCTAMPWLMVLRSFAPCRTWLKTWATPSRSS